MKLKSLTKNNMSEITFMPNLRVGTDAADGILYAEIINDLKPKKTKNPRPPIKLIKKNIKKMSGGIKTNMTETIRYVDNGHLSMELVVTDNDTNNDPVGRIVIDEGYIVDFTFRDDLPTSTITKTINILLNQSIKEADAINGNLLIQLDQNIERKIKDILERYGFRHIKENVYRRRPGSIMPPLVNL